MKRMGVTGLGGVLGLTAVDADGAPARPSERLFSPTPGHRLTRAPLADVPYTRLPLGDVQPAGWLQEQLRRMGEGMAGQLDELYTIVDDDNAWLGGRGDNWERGPYWVDGLVPLAYLLEDDALIEKANQWVDWSLSSQRSDGFFGPAPSKNYKEGPSGKPGAFIQTENPEDWWPRMVMLKALRSHYEATGDERVLDLMTQYFRYQLNTLPQKPLGHWTWWAEMRGGENHASIYWLYNQTGDDFLLELASLVFEQTANWTEGFLEEGPLPSDHGVNVAMGIKQPALHYLQTKDERFLRAPAQALKFLERRHGQPQGMFSGDEPLHGTDPTQGTELCTIVELMYSLQTLTRITGRVDYMDRWEKVAYNALPTQHRDDYRARQYYQQPNQIRINRGPKNFKTGPTGIRLCYGLTSGYPCCTTNMHQGWPKHVRNLWMASQDGGLAALMYGPSVLETTLDGHTVRIEENTDYPFDNEVQFVFSTDDSIPFPLHLRIPGWVDGHATVFVNGSAWSTPGAGQVIRVHRTWHDGDEVRLQLPMAVQATRWHEDAASVKRGPIVYALSVDGEWKPLGDDYEPTWELNDQVPTWTVEPIEPWNYSVVLDEDDPSQSFDVEQTGDMPTYPWTADDVPIRLTGTGKRLPWWNEYHGGAGPLPPSPVYPNEPDEEIELIPYGATTLRVSELPVTPA